MRKKFTGLVAFASESSGAKAIIVVGGRNNVIEVEILKVQANKWESAILEQLTASLSLNCLAGLVLPHTSDGE